MSSMFELVILVISAVINISLGVVVYVKNSESATNKLFFMLTSSFAAWSIVNYLSVHPVILPQLIWVRFVLFLATFLCLCVYLTFNVFPHYTLPPSKWTRKIATITAAVVMLLTLTPLVFKDLKIQNGNAQPVPSFGLPFFALTVVGLLAGGVITLVKKYHVSRGDERTQIRFVLFGLAGAFTLIVVTNFLFVVILHNTKLIPLGPAYTLIFSGSLAYAIVKHKLFDIRAAAARALAYLLSLGFIGAIYGGLIFLVSALLAHGESLGPTQRAFYVGLALLTALFYQRIKKFFDRVTNNFFFKDSYDPQYFIDQLNDILVGTIQIDELLNLTASLVTRTLKASYVKFIITDNSKSDNIRVIGSGRQITDAILDETVDLLNAAHSKLFITDELEAQGQAHLRNILNRQDAAVAVRLSTHEQQIGYLVVGFKQSGDYYHSNDINLLDIISNEVALAIQNALRFEEIEKFNITLQEKVDTATKQLRKTNDKLRELDQAKDEFISMASHQLRTPLTSMKGYVSMVLEGDSGKISTMQRKLLDQAFVSSQRMVYLIADLLNVSRLKTGKFIIETKPTNLADVVGEELSQLTETAKGRNLALTYDKPKDFPLLMLDETKIRQVVMNFVDNAIYYTPSGGHIKANIVEKPETVEFTVVDDGLGVPKADQHHLFNKFYRAGNARKARPDGTGLGLFMAKKVIVAQGGAIIFSSTEGKGSTFGFTFSKAKLKPTPEQLKSAPPSTSSHSSVHVADEPQAPSAPEPKKST